ncbi:MAG: ring,2-phenylacetyl-CoA epoxidase subunit PaaD [Candidatus Eremiobacteraeota bacterium]|nr:ring,2-phenylacetyl-CoA epoxidase subunit PaaD [Candidatus Eremiobacteraeota bacterium]
MTVAHEHAAPVAAASDVAAVWEWLADVPDPEIPVLSVVDLGIVREVSWRGEGAERALHVALSPTYSGCPATTVIRRDIESALRAHGVANPKLEVRLAPPWSTDWISPAGREKLRAYGIAPPSAPRAVVCPRCAAAEVELVSRFGSTPCKALYRCNACREPFDHFKCH